MRYAKLGTLLVLVAMAALSIGSGITVAADPAGNNGTVKVDGTPFDSSPDNEPHVGCIFQIDFYGFDKGDLNAIVTFEAQPPSGRDLILQDTVFIGEDSNAGGGSEAGLDASARYDLNNAVSHLEAQAQQGFHISLTIEADGSQGANVKHKTFWVRGCAPEPSGGDETTTTTN
jgi:hypothetical protein